MNESPSPSKFSLPSLKVRGFISIWEFDEFAKKHNFRPNQKFALKIKKGRRWKLRCFRYVSYEYRNCECCGAYQSLTIYKGGKFLSGDTHFGPSGFSVSDLLSLNHSV